MLLWVDTVTDHFAPQIAQAAVEVLEAAGFAVTVPPKGWLCCGITWVSSGQLDAARRVLRKSLKTIERAASADVPVVCLEPSCTATLRSDLVELLPDDPRAAALAARTHTLVELLERYAPDWSPPRVDTPALTQPHCHQHAVLGFDADRRMLAKMGLTDAVLDAGCCGLAGAFGFEREHYDVSVAVAEHALLPALRAAPEALLLADGFSCRTQIEQLAHRRVRHLAELMRDALRGSIS